MAHVGLSIFIMLYILAACVAGRRHFVGDANAQDGGELGVSSSGNRAVADLEVVALWEKTFGGQLEGLEGYAQQCLEGYWNVPYHNKEHALDVYKFVLDVFSAGEVLSSSSKKAVALAALCHDYGHPGLNNGFMSQYHMRPSKYANKLTDEEKRAADSINTNGTPQGGWSAIGGKAEMGTFIPYTLKNGLQLLPPTSELPFPAFKGCAKSEVPCSSIEESYHAQQALRILEASSVAVDNPENAKAVIEQVILHTDFGQDYLMREELDALGDNPIPKSLAENAALHIADINAACSENFLWWAGAVIAEFIRQAHVSETAFPLDNVHAFAKSQQSWAVGVRAIFKVGFRLLGVTGSKGAMSAWERLERNIVLWGKCVDATENDPSLFKFALEGKAALELREEIIQKTLQACSAAWKSEAQLSMFGAPP